MSNKTTGSLVITLLLLLAGCGGRYASDRTTIRFSIWGDVAEIKYYNDAKKVFEKKNPDIRIVFEHTPSGTYYDRLLVTTAGGIPPDVAFLGTGRILEFIKKGILEPLDGYMAGDKQIRRELFYDVMVKACSFKGTLYLLPRDTAPIGLIYYNIDLFQKADVPLPTTSWTMDDFLKAAKALTVRDPSGNATQYGFATWVWPDFIFANGGGIVDDCFHPTRFTITSEASLKGFQYWLDLMTKYKVMPTTAQSGSFNWDYNSMFQMGKAAMILSGIWETPSLLKTAKFDWDITVFPAYRHRVLGGGSGYGILRSCRNKAAAWRVVRFFGGPEGQRLLALAQIAQPAIRELARSEIFTKSSSKPHNKIVCDMESDYQVEDPMFEGYNEFNTSVIIPNLDLLNYGKIDLAEFKRRLDVEINKRYPGSLIKE